MNKERLNEIITQLNTHPYVSIEELSLLLQIPKEELQADLKELEDQGILRWSFQDANVKGIQNSELHPGSEMAVFNKEKIAVEEKDRICSVAADMIKAGDFVYVDGGSTVLPLWKYIKDKRIHIVTPSTYFLAAMPDEGFRGEITLLGGDWKQSYGMSYGTKTLEEIRNLNFDICFLSTNGIHLSTGEVYTFDFSIGAVKREVMKRSASKVLLADSSKYSIKAVCTWANLKDFTTIVSDSWPQDVQRSDHVKIC